MRAAVKEKDRLSEWLMMMDHWRRRPSTTAGFAILIADARVLANEVNVLGGPGHVDAAVMTGAARLQADGSLVYPAEQRDLFDSAP
jgi:hypothetical protein